MIDWSALKIEDASLPSRRGTNPRPSRYTCANCLRQFQAKPSGPVEPYCSIRCSDEARAVRYARAKLAEYRTCRLPELPEDIYRAIRMKIAHALAGGYDQQRRRLPAAVRQAIFDRDQSRCVLCGEVGTEVDHIDGPSPEPENLRLLCRDCHLAVTEARFVPVENGTRQAARSSELRKRTFAQQALRPCDAADWHSTWQAWVRQHSSPALAP